ncbi:MAG: hypothetical protein DWP95_12760 [Proteobacteria bacterium]|nr:MAG: hypothetical protein DWP95_12760 [Pseudomonadota bacterium]
MSVMRFVVFILVLNPRIIMTPSTPTWVIHNILVSPLNLIFRKSSMKISVEISLYPLTENFLTVVNDFIQRLRREPDLTIRVNDLSTQVFGDYQTVLSKVNAAMQTTHNQTPKAAFVMKVLNGDLLDEHSDKYA